MLQRKKPETDLFPLLPPPSLPSIPDILSGMKNGAAAGTDGIEVELIKYLPDELLEEFASFLE